ERREEDLGRGLARLRQHAAALAREPLPTFCDEILEGMAGGGSDDVALIAVRATSAASRLSHNSARVSRVASRSRVVR
ncbi:hypothetical protein ACIRQV_27365, partial [Streptomyces microflavus]